MNPFYDRAADNALKMIAAKGVIMDIRRFALIDSDFSSGDCTRVIEKQGLLTALILTGGDSPASAEMHLADGLIKGQQLEILAAAKNAPFQPAPLDEVEYGALNWLTVAVTTVAPGGVPLLYRLIAVAKQ